MEDAQGAANRLQMNCARHVHFWKNLDCDRMTFILKYKDINEEKEILTVLIEFLGRPSPTEVAFTEAKKIEAE